MKTRNERTKASQQHVSIENNQSLQPFIHLYRFDQNQS